MLTRAAAIQQDHPVVLRVVRQRLWLQAAVVTGGGLHEQVHGEAAGGHAEDEHALPRGERDGRAGERGAELGAADSEGSRHGIEPD